jgi:L-ribulose-5-phosphate 4-epimerase
MSNEQIKLDYETETGRQITDTFTQRSPSETPMVLVRSHGPFTWGDTPGHAVHNSILLEELARMAYYTLQINPEASRLDDALIKKHYERKHGKDAYYGQP